MLVWVKAYISLFLIFAMLLYLLPSDVYRRYLRFFLEMILVRYRSLISVKELRELI